MSQHFLIKNNKINNLKKLNNKINNYKNLLKIFEC